MSDELTITIAIDRDDLTPVLAQLDSIDTSEALLSAGKSVKDFLVQYHTDFEERWRGDHYMAGPHSGEWAREIPVAWQEPQLVGEGAVSISNMHPHLAHKVLGGTIAPVSAAALTIPLIPEAKGVPAREFPEPLFIPKGVSVLAMGGEGGPFVPVYALVQSVSQGPWPGALPENEAIADIFKTNFMIQLDAALSAAASGELAGAAV